MQPSLLILEAKTLAEADCHYTGSWFYQEMEPSFHQDMCCVKMSGPQGRVVIYLSTYNYLIVSKKGENPIPLILAIFICRIM